MYGILNSDHQVRNEIQEIKREFITRPWYPLVNKWLFEVGFINSREGNWPVGISDTLFNPETSQLNYREAPYFTGEVCVEIDGIPMTTSLADSSFGAGGPGENQPKPKE